MLWALNKCILWLFDFSSVASFIQLLHSYVSLSTTMDDQYYLHTTRKEAPYPYLIYKRLHTTNTSGTYCEIPTQQDPRKMWRLHVELSSELMIHIYDGCCFVCDFLTVSEFSINPVALLLAMYTKLRLHLFIVHKLSLSFPLFYFMDVKY